MENAPKPLLSIATCVLNARDDFVETALSLPALLPDWIEWIVVDGGSTDGTYEAVTSDARVTRHLSEPDPGVYYAYNKALALATGSYIWYLNAGDTAEQATLATLREPLEMAVNQGSNRVLCFAVNMQSGGWIWNPEPTRMLDGMSVPTPGVLAPRAALVNLRGFDTAYRIASDYDIWLRLFMASPKQFESRVPVLANYKGGGLSAKHRHLAFFEECVAQLRHDSNLWANCLLRAARRAVFDLDPNTIPHKRWKLALRLGKRFLY